MSGTALSGSSERGPFMEQRTWCMFVEQRTRDTFWEQWRGGLSGSSEQGAHSESCEREAHSGSSERGALSRSSERGARLGSSAVAGASKGEHVSRVYPSPHLPILPHLSPSFPLGADAPNMAVAKVSSSQRALLRAMAKAFHSQLHSTINQSLRADAPNMAHCTVGRTPPYVRGGRP